MSSNINVEELKNLLKRYNSEMTLEDRAIQLDLKMKAISNSGELDDYFWIYQKLQELYIMLLDCDQDKDKEIVGITKVKRVIKSNRYVDNKDLKGRRVTYLSGLYLVVDAVMIPKSYEPYINMKKNDLSTKITYNHPEQFGLPSNDEVEWSTCKELLNSDNIIVLSKSDKLVRDYFYRSIYYDYLDVDFS